MKLKIRWSQLFNLQSYSCYLSKVILSFFVSFKSILVKEIFFLQNVKKSATEWNDRRRWTGRWHWRFFGWWEYSIDSGLWRKVCGKCVLNQAAMVFANVVRFIFNAEGKKANEICFCSLRQTSHLVFREKSQLLPRFNSLLIDIYMKFRS